MRFVDYDQRVARQVIEQCRRRLTRLLAGEMARIVFDTATKAHLFQHFQIEHGPLVQSLCFDEFSFFDQLWLPPFQFLANRPERALECAARHHIVRLRVNR